MPPRLTQPIQDPKPPSPPTEPRPEEPRSESPPPEVLEHAQPKQALLAQQESDLSDPQKWHQAYLKDLVKQFQQVQVSGRRRKATQPPEPQPKGSDTEVSASKPTPVTSSATPNQLRQISEPSLAATQPSINGTPPRDLAPSFTGPSNLPSAIFARNKQKENKIQVKIGLFGVYETEMKIHRSTLRTLNMRLKRKTDRRLLRKRRSQTALTGPISHPASTGLLERTVQEMLALISKRCIQRGTTNSWSLFMRDNVLELNTKTTRIHRFQPAKITLGFEPK